MSQKPSLSEKLAALPDRPGVYLMKDRAGRVIYVGKSACLRARVRSYFQASSEHSPKIRWMVARIVDFEIVLVDSEVEALILECNLIKRYRPYFNMKYRDDKRYPMLEVTTSEEFPRIRVVRRPRNPRNRTFGPYPDAGAMRRTITILQKVFQIRTCSLDMNKKVARPCLDYYIGLCTAPCTRFVNAEQYARQVEAAVEFLEGRCDRLVKNLKAEMEREAEALNFERCIRLRDMLSDLERVAEKQKIVSERAEDEDYVALEGQGELVCAQVLQVREGKLVGHRSLVLEAPGQASPQEQMAAFLKTYYQEQAVMARRVLVCVEPEDRELLMEWLSSLAGARVELRVPQRGSKRELMELAVRNARSSLEQERLRPSRGSESRRRGLEHLAAELGLAEPPWRIECVDISNFQGRQAVGSLVVFDQGQPRPDQYRRFRIRSGDTPDDFRMMGEVLRRRFTADPQDRRKFESLPDLLVVDGGKGQLGVAVEVLAELGLNDRVPVAGLAKEHEWLFRPGRSSPICLPLHSPGLLLVTHLRDEAHRFAVGYHRNLRKRELKASLLDEAPGIGEGRRQALLKHFGSLSKLAQASPQELAQVDGIGPKLARQLRDYLRTLKA